MYIYCPNSAIALCRSIPVYIAIVISELIIADTIAKIIFVRIVLFSIYFLISRCFVFG